MKNLLLSVALILVIADISSGQTLLQPELVVSNGPSSNSLDLVFDSNVPNRGTSFNAPVSFHWIGTDTEVIFDYGETVLISDLLIAADNNDTYLIEYSLDGSSYQTAFEFLGTDGENIGGLDLLTTISSFPTFPTNPSIAAFVGRDFPDVSARFLRVTSTAGDFGKAIGEFQAFTSDTVDEIGFDLQVANPFASIFRLENTSSVQNAEIVEVAMFIGNTNYNFDIVGGEDVLADSEAPITSLLTAGDAVQGEIRTDYFSYELTGFEPADRFAFSVDLDLDTGDSGQDIREIYFNNGDLPNAIFLVTFDVAGQSHTLRLTLPDDPLVDDPQVFNYSVSQTVEVPELSLLGDVNRDETVNFLDIAPFIAVLSTSGFQDEADINRDGSVNFLDIGPFIALLQ